jgi:zinc transport system permease protein
MNELLHQLFTPSGILFYPLLIGLLGSISFGIIGSYTVVRHVSYAAHGISHAVLLGIGATLFLNHLSGWNVSPIVGAFLVALAAAWMIGSFTLYAPHRADSVISAVMVLGMSGGLLFLAKTPGYFEPMSVLFGDILLVSRTDAVLIGLFNLLVILTGVCFYTRLQMICFDEEFARLRGIHVEFWFVLLLSLVALTIVTMMQMVGIVLVIALLTLPVMAALRFCHRLWQVMLMSATICAGCVLAGLALSYQLDLPTGPVIVLLAGAVYLISLFDPGRSSGIPAGRRRR